MKIKRRVNVNPRRLKKHIGQILTANELKNIVGYSKTTYINDTSIYQRGMIQEINTSSVRKFKVLNFYE